MKRKVFMSLLSCIMIFSLVDCGEVKTLNVNVENSDSLNSNILGEQSFIEIGSGLHYDSSTRIVYMLNKTYNGWNVFTPYYAPNGFPYRYNPETNTFEEIMLNQ